MKRITIILAAIVAATFGLKAQTHAPAFQYSISSLSGLSNGDNITVWNDETSQNNDAVSFAGLSTPTYGVDAFNGIQNGVVFDGNSMLSIPNTDDINTDAINKYQTKTMALVFQTSADVSSRQVIYEEGGGWRGLNIYIYNDRLYFGIYNWEQGDPNASGSWGGLYISESISANTAYLAEFVYDYPNNEFKAYLNGTLIQTISTDLGVLSEHDNEIGIGGNTNVTIMHDGSQSGYMFFNGVLGDSYYFQEALTESELDNERQTKNLESRFGLNIDNSTLPIELIDFSADSRDNRITLKWSTASELNNDYFSLEKSYDANHFHTITDISGAGNSHEVLHYTYQDYDTKQKVYYRLKQTDFNGDFTYSAIIVVNNTKAASPQYISTPGQISIHFPEVPESGIVSIFTTSGQLIARKTIDHSQLNISTTSIGKNKILLIRSVINNKVQTKKLLTK